MLWQKIDLCPKVFLQPPGYSRIDVKIFFVTTKNSGANGNAARSNAFFLCY